MRRMADELVRIPSDGRPFDAFVMDGSGHYDGTLQDGIDAEWREFRNTGIGGSDVAAIMGISRWRSPVEVWVEKTGRAPAKDLSGNEAVEWGTRLEDTVREKFRENHPELVVMQLNATLVSRDRPWAHANLDGRVRDADGNWGVLEIKTADARKSDEWASGVPDYYVTQVTHYMSVTGWGYAWVAVLIGGNTYREYRIERDEDDIAMVSGFVDEFWKGYVEADVMPAIVGTGHEGAALMGLYPSGEGSMDVPAEDMAAVDEVCRRYEDARGRESAAKADKAVAANELKAILGDHKSMDTDVYRATWSRSTRVALDVDRLRAELPDVYEEYSRVVPRDGGVRVSARKR